MARWSQLMSRWWCILKTWYLISISFVFTGCPFSVQNHIQRDLESRHLELPHWHRLLPATTASPSSLVLDDLDSFEKHCPGTGFLGRGLSQHPCFLRNPESGCRTLSPPPLLPLFPPMSVPSLTTLVTHSSRTSASSGPQLEGGKYERDLNITFIRRHFYLSRTAKEQPFVRHWPWAQTRFWPVLQPFHWILTPTLRISTVHVTGKETSLGFLSHSLKVTQLNNGTARIQSHSYRDLFLLLSLKLSTSRGWHCVRWPNTGYLTYQGLH